MPGLLQRGSSTNKFIEDGWSHEEAPVILQSGSDQCGVIHDKASLLILLSAVFKRGLLFSKSQDKAVEDDMSEDVQSFLNGSNSDKGFFTQLPELSTLPCNPSHSNSFIGLPTQVQNRRLLSSPLAKITMLSFISIFVLVAVLGSTSAGYSSLSSSSASRLLYNSYRRLQEDFSSLDLISGGIFGLGSLHPKELMICSKDLEHHVPCYNVTSAYKSGLGNVNEYDRHCELWGGRTPCLTPPPKNYSLPLRWPHSKHSVWIGNFKLTDELKGSKMERITWGKDNQLLFEPQDAEGVDGHVNKISDLLGISHGTLFSKAGVQTVLDIGCSYGSFAAHLLSRNVMTICIASYEFRDSHVQLALDRGLPAMIGSLVTRQLPYPGSSFSMIHCADCGIDWGQKDGLLLLEVDRLLKAEGYFVWMMRSVENSTDDVDREQILKIINENAKIMCWTSLTPKGGVFVWRKSADRSCSTHLNKTFSVCGEDKNGDIGVYQGLRDCLDVMKQGPVLSQQQLASSVSSGFSWEELADDSAAWLSTVKNYWSIITPLLFSDHPKRPAEDDPLPPFNILRNIMDMNALYGGFNAALLEAGKSVWVMNVVPTSGPNTLRVIYQRGLIGTLHDWCQAFPTYPRTYDLLHGIGILSQQAKARTRCSLSSFLLEMDRILRPEGWVLLRDRIELIEEARFAAAQMRWEARIIEVDGATDLRLLVCQKVFWKR